MSDVNEFDGVPLDPDGQPEPPLNANKKPMPEALDWLPTTMEQARTAPIDDHEETDDADPAA